MRTPPLPPLHSLIVRLLAPVLIMLTLVATVQTLDGAVRRRVIAAGAQVEAAQSRALALAELRSISRSLQRDALNLVTERDPAELDAIRRKFDKRHREFAQRLQQVAQAGDDGQLEDYAATQARVWAELRRARSLAASDRSAALAAFRTRVRPAERHASEIADRAIDVSLTSIRRAKVDAARQQRSEGRELAAIAILLTGLAVALASWLIVATILRPLADIQRAMDRLATGHADADVPHGDRKDEIGAMARSIRVFRAATLERDTLRAERAEEQRDALSREAAEAGKRTMETQRKQLLRDLAAAIDANLAVVNEKLRQSAVRLSRSADAVSQQAGEAAMEAERTTDAARQAASDLLAVTSASAQLADTVHRLREQTGAAAAAIGRAAERSRSAGVRVAALTAHADRVSGMAETIRAVAHRSRLLALNATIEAARVGEAGRGFAIVAGEIKTLAGQTAAVTHEVEEQASSIRLAADEAVTALAEIEAEVAQIAGDAAAVGSAMTQQGAAGVEIGAGMRTALAEVEQVASRMGELRRTATATGAVANTLQADAAVLGADASSVDVALRSLVGDLRAAA